MTPSNPPPWLLLVHQIPGKPDYLRVKIGRRLAALGAVAVKSTVYALPNRDACREGFEWVLREIVDGAGEALLCAVELVAGLDDEDVRSLFRQARGRDYEELVAEATAARERWDAGGDDADAERRTLATTAGRLERRLAAVRGIDFFAAPEASRAAAAVAALRERLLGGRAAAGAAPPGSSPRGGTWTTRAGVKEDRIASAWLVRRFIDPAATFRFVAADAPRQPGEVRFDMFGGEHTHEGDRCTFEVLCERFGLDDPALVAIGEIVHDVDLGDGKFGRPESEGFARFVSGLVRLCPDDDERLARGAAFLDALHAAFAGDVRTSPPSARREPAPRRG